MEALTADAIAQWVAAHREWIYIIVAIIAFMESFALIGIVVPGVILLFGAATAAGSESINIFGLLTAGFVGAVIGDGVSFLLGYRYHEQIKQFGPFKKHPEWIERGEDFFQRYGLISIVLGRFIGPIRPVMPLIAGMLSMRPQSFLIVNIASALAWAPFYLLPGYALGAAVSEADAVTLERIMPSALACLGAWLASIIITRFINSSEHIYGRLTHAERGHSDLKPIITLVFIFFGIFLLLSTSHQWYWSQQLDRSIHEYFESSRAPWINPFWIFVSYLGSSWVLSILTIVISFGLIIQRHYQRLVIFNVTWLSSVVLMHALKNLFQRIRPEGIIEVSSHAFPSGHAMLSVVFAGLVWSLLSHRITESYRDYVLHGLIIYALLVSISRQFLGVHWMSDTLAGLSLGTVIVLLYTRFSSKR